jgi:hypothetical protein
MRPCGAALRKAFRSSRATMMSHGATASREGRFTALLHEKLNRTLRGWARTHELGIEQCDDAARAADAVQTAPYSGREAAEAAIFA